MIRKGYIDTKGGQVHYRAIRAEGKEPLVFLHQTASSSAMYERLMRELQGEYDLVAPDTPGFGESYSPAEKPTTVYYANVFWEALTNVGIERCHLFGHHTGSALAAEMAAVAPERTLSVTLSGPTYYGSEAEREERRQRVVKPFRLMADGSHLPYVWRRVKGGEPGVPLTLSNRECADTLRAGERWPEAYEAVFAQDLHAVLEQLSCPIFFMCGDTDMLRPQFEAATKAFPQVRKAVLHGSGFIVDENPIDVASAIKDFLKEV